MQTRRPIILTEVSRPSNSILPRMRSEIRGWVTPSSLAASDWGFRAIPVFPAATASARDSTGRVRPGNLPHNGDLSAGGALLVGDLGQAPPSSDKDARWHDRAT